MTIIAANFKTNHTRKSTKEYLETVSTFIEDNKFENEIYIFPTATSLDDTKQSQILMLEHKMLILHKKDLSLEKLEQNN